MKIAVKNSGDRKKIILMVEKFDVANMQEIKKNIEQEINAEKSNVLLDLSVVKFIDSSGLSVIIALFKQQKKLKKKLEICGLQKQPMELLKITQLHKIFMIIDNCNKR